MSTFYIDSASFGDIQVTGSLFVSNTINVNTINAQTSSIQYITSSQLNVGTNIITVNTSDPSVRFGGLAVIDSGSSPARSGSLLFDSENNQWIFVHQNTAGADVTSSVLIMGPQTFNNIGNETTIGINRLTKGQLGDLGEHITSSNITDTGTTVSINSDTQITGSLILTAGITGSLFGTASWAQNSQTASYIAWANVSEANTDTFIGTASFAQTASFINNMLTTGKVISLTQISYPFSGF